MKINKRVLLMDLLKNNVLYHLAAVELQPAFRQE